MTKDWYIQHGFKMSSLIDQLEIDRAEEEVRVAYIDKIVGSAQAPTALVEKAVSNLAFFFLLQQSIHLTRAGAKLKTGYNSQEAEAWSKLQECSRVAHLALEELRKVDGANAEAEVFDLCGIYFKSNFISI